MTKPLILTLTLTLTRTPTLNLNLTLPLTLTLTLPLTPTLSGITPEFAGRTVEEMLDLFERGIGRARGWVRAQKQVIASLPKGKNFPGGFAAYETGVNMVEAGVFDTGDATGAVTELLIKTGRYA